MKEFESKCIKISLLALTPLIFLVLPITCILAQDLRCATCGKVITGHYKVYKGEPYCSESCVGDALPKCVVCGKPALRYVKATEDPGKIYCSLECFQTSLSKCEICREPLTHWVTIKNHKYCNNCAKLPKCSSCRLPGAERKLADGRPICSRCMETAIIDQEHAERLFRQVRDDIHKSLNLRTGHPIQLYLKDGAGLTALVGRHSSNEQGYYQVSAKYQMRRGTRSLVSETYSIYVLSALSPAYFGSTAAHELAHDLGHALYPSVKKKEDVEGFAEYISSRMNSFWGNDELNEEKLRNQEKDYASAYMKFLNISSNNGLRDVLGYMERQNRMAGGK